MDGASGAAQFETVIIGGGQAGLAVGYHLARQGQRFVILDANPRIGDPWRTRWESLRLFTPARYNGLPGWPFPAPAWSYPTKDQVADYLETYATRFELPVRTGVRVDRLSREGDRYVVAAGARRFQADHVVVATGAYQRPRIPTFAAELDAGIVQLHSGQYRDPSRLREGGVLVVGAANSGAEIALEVSGDHPTWLSGRHPGQEPFGTGSRKDRLVLPVVWFMASHVLTVKTPMGRMARRRFHGGASRSPGATASGSTAPPGSGGCRGRPGCGAACRCSTMDGSWRSPTWSGAPASCRTSAGSTCRCSTRTAARCMTAASSDPSRACTSWDCCSSIP
jgi:cation diffusion facilitator CzcD-associated flavoprotein CzcO